VSKTRVLVKYWLPVLVWMLVIFSASGDARSFQHSSRLIGPLVRWLFPQLPEETVGAIVFAVRKAAHVTEYAILAILFWRALRRPVSGDARPWSWREGGLVVLLAALYAASDEFHQRFVPSRDSSLLDVLIDTGGALFGLLAVRLTWPWWQGRRGDNPRAGEAGKPASD
jgi:VanZ family protein